MQPMRVLSRLRQVVNDIDKYTLLRHLQQDNAGLFYELMFAHTEELLPHVYTPTVGQACQEYCQRGFATRGLYITAEDRGRYALHGPFSSSCCCNGPGHHTCPMDLERHSHSGGLH